MAPPAFDDDLRFAQGVEDLAIEQFVAKAGIKALDVAVLPRTAGFDVGGLGTNRGDPLLHGFGDKLWSIVGSDMVGDAPQDEEVGQNINDIDRLELAVDMNRQTSRSTVRSVGEAERMMSRTSMPVGSSGGRKYGIASPT